MRISVVPYRADWPQMFREEAQRVAEAFGGNLLHIFHIGSTSVPGLAAKPIIDIMPVVRSLRAVDANQSAFEQLGYEYMGEFGMAGRRYMRKGGDERTHQIHTFQYSNAADITRHLALRQYLRHHPAVCAAYGSIKADLAAKHPADIEAYSDGKDAFVKQAEQDALQWYWAHWAEG